MATSFKTRYPKKFSRTMQGNTAEDLNTTKQAGTREVLSSYVKSLSGLAEVETLIKSKLTSEAPILTDISTYLLELGGKRIRPALCLMGAKALGKNKTAKQSEQLIQIAAGIELIHMATLLHDDIIDKSKIRRHKSSPLLKYGINSTLLAGDFLLTRAFSLCAKLDQYVIEKTEEACVDLTEGEVLELPLNEKKHDLESSLLISRKKTAALFRLAAECAAHISTSDKEVVTLFANFGQNIGIAFQVMDDVLDVIASEETLGKEPGSDIRERKPSVVNVLWLETESPLSKRLLTNQEEDESKFVAEAMKEINSSGTIEKAKKIAREYAEKAASYLTQAESLTEDKDSSAFSAMHGLVDYCIQRME